MVRLQEFDIVMRNTSGVFYGGEPVYGEVTLQLQEPMKMIGMEIVLHGGCRVKFPQSSKPDVYYSDAETYFHKTATLYGIPRLNENGEQNRKTTMHPAGKYSYPFRFELPRRTPTSFEGLHGRVRYWIRATINRPVKFNLESERIFTVISHLNLNTIADIMAPIEESRTASSWLFSCSPWSVRTQISLERRGYVPGQYMAIHGEVVNKSEKDLKSHRLELVQLEVYEAEGKQFQTHSVLETLQKGKIPSGEVACLNEMFLVPAVAPSHLIGSSFIDIRYVLRLVVDGDEHPGIVTLPVEVLIGTRPLRNSFGVYAATSDATHNEVDMRAQSLVEEVTSPPRPALPSTVGMSLPAIQVLDTTDGGAPLPSYVKCKLSRMNVSADGYIAENKDGDWVPTYVYFTWLPAFDKDVGLNALLADFSRQKTMVLQREKTKREMFAIPESLKLKPENTYMV